MSFFHLRPSEIRYTQDSISNTFGNYGRYANKLIGESLDDVLLGYCSVDDIPTIRVININSAWYSADNRRLWVLKKVEELGKCTKIPVYLDYYLPDHKFTTENDGLEVSVRRNPGGSVWRRWAPKRNHGKSGKTVTGQHSGSKQTKIKETSNTKRDQSDKHVMTQSSDDRRHETESSELRLPFAHSRTSRTNKYNYFGQDVDDANNQDNWSNCGCIIL